MPWVQPWVLKQPSDTPREEKRRENHPIAITARLVMLCSTTKKKIKNCACVPEIGPTRSRWAKGRGRSRHRGRLQRRRVSPTVSKCQPRGQLVKANNNETNLIRKNHLDDGDDGDDGDDALPTTSISTHARGNLFLFSPPATRIGTDLQQCVPSGRVQCKTGRMPAGVAASREVQFIPHSM